ncbi:nicotinate phosphoribosyltransferase, partial [Coemansia erecta]
ELSDDSTRLSFTVMSYNILCQKLVRRDLFKYASKNSLRMKPRRERMLKELKYWDADIMCLQEVGTEEWQLVLGPQCKRANYDSHMYQSLSKSHGVCISWKKDRFHLVDQAYLAMDRSMKVCDEALNTDNVALIVVLRPDLADPAEDAKSDTGGAGGKNHCPGIIVSSTHLFWHPTACYQRLQQQIALMTAVQSLQQKYPGYPVISCGDYNTTPDDAGYDLLTKHRPVALNEWQLDNLLPVYFGNEKRNESEKKENLAEESSAQPSSNDTLSYASMATAGTDAETNETLRKRRKLEEEERVAEEQLEKDVKRVQTLVSTFQGDFAPMRSCYGTYADLDPSYKTDKWAGEPIYTNYTAWKGTLDYIFYTPGMGLDVREIMSADSIEREGTPDSILDQDLYKFCMQQAVLEHYPDVYVEYGFVNRDTTARFNQRSFDWMRARIDSLSEIIATEDDIEYLRSTCSYLSDDYLQFLSKYRFDPSTEVFCSLDKERSALDLTIKGKWSQVILYEIPLLSLISEAYFKFVDRDWNYDGQYEKTIEKGNRLAQAGCNFAEFGTRRRRNFRTQDIVMAALLSIRKDSPGRLTDFKKLH